MLPVEDYIRKIWCLEKELGSRVNHKILEPFTLSPTNLISLQEAAKRIAQSVKLDYFTFIVAQRGQDKKVGGQIDLRDEEGAVLIELSPSVTLRSESVLTVLAHEIAHKYIEVNKCMPSGSKFDTYENEVFTDITAVYIGFGKLMLNGMEVENVETKYGLGGSREERHEVHKLGYLTMDQIAFVYRLICTMRGINPVVYRRNLSLKAQKALDLCGTQYRGYFDKRYHKPRIRGKVRAELLADVRRSQLMLADIEKAKTCINYSYIKSAESFLIEKHRQFADINEELNATKDICGSDTPLTFLDTMIMDKMGRRQIHSIKNEILKRVAKTRNVVKFILRDAGTRSCLKTDILLIITCGQCGTKISLPRDLGIKRIECGHCKYRFYVNTTPPLWLSHFSKVKKSLFARIFKKHKRK